MSAIVVHALRFSNFSYDDVHVKVARSIARLARECGVQRLIHFSALNASSSPPPIIFGKPSRFLQSKVHQFDRSAFEPFSHSVCWRIGRARRISGCDDLPTSSDLRKSIPRRIHLVSFLTMYVCRSGMRSIRDRSSLLCRS